MSRFHAPEFRFDLTAIVQRVMPRLPGQDHASVPSFGHHQTAPHSHPKRGAKPCAGLTRLVLDGLGSRGLRDEENGSNR